MDTGFASATSSRPAVQLERQLRFRRDINVNSFGHVVSRGGLKRSNTEHKT
jgi:hypothetical protein